MAPKMTQEDEKRMGEISLQTILDRIREENIEFIDLQAVDLNGRLRRVTLPAANLDDSILSAGVGFDSSSYGLSTPEDSDMVLVPDLASATRDPFREAPSLMFFSNILHTDSGRSRYADDPRWIAMKAEQALQKLGVAEQSWWAPEYEFYIFPEVEFCNTPTDAMVRVELGEFFVPTAYHATPPLDRYIDFRDTAVHILNDLGVDVRYHHHEGGRAGQQEIEGVFTGLLEAGDRSILVKYTLNNLAKRFGYQLTFMPKPVLGHAGNGWHCHQYLTHADKNIFYKAGGGFGNLSLTAQHYVGGLLKHTPALMAFTNPTTNSYKRMVEGHEAPVAMSFGQANRHSAIRIPKYVANPERTRIEFRPPDPMANPYLALAGMLMAGMDGILKRVDPQTEGFAHADADTRGDRRGQKPSLPRTLDEALDALEIDHGFLTAEGVFSEALIERWIQLKRKEARSVYDRPHPYEFELYFDL
jgi:glutamine synthetase